MSRGATASLPLLHGAFKRWPELGDVIEVSGMELGWGIVRQRVLPR